MNNLIMRKFQTTIAMMAGMGFVCILFVIFSLFSCYKNHSLNKKLVKQQKQLNIYNEKYGQDPDKFLKKYSVLRLDLETKYNEYAKEFKSRIPAKEIIADPLIFKDKLFSLQDDIYNKAQEKGIQCPKDFGFKDYSLAVPGMDELDLLSRELFAIESVTNSLIDSNVREITAVSLNHEYLQANLRSFPLELSFISSFSSLKKFLNNLAKQDSVYIANNMNVEKKGRSSLAVTMILIYSDV